MKQRLIPRMILRPRNTAHVTAYLETKKKSIASPAQTSDTPRQSRKVGIFPEASITNEAAKNPSAHEAKDENAAHELITTDQITT